jgi:hypothetical protein
MDQFDTSLPLLVTCAQRPMSAVRSLAELSLSRLAIELALVVLALLANVAGQPCPSLMAEASGADAG